MVNSYFCETHSGRYFRTKSVIRITRKALSKVFVHLRGEARIAVHNQVEVCNAALLNPRNHGDGYKLRAVRRGQEFNQISYTKILL